MARVITALRPAIEKSAPARKGRSNHRWHQRRWRCHQRDEGGIGRDGRCYRPAYLPRQKTSTVRGTETIAVTGVGARNDAKHNHDAQK